MGLSYEQGSSEPQESPGRQITQFPCVKIMGEDRGERVVSRGAKAANDNRAYLRPAGRKLVQ